MKTAHTIEVDDDVMELLKREAEPFVDSPNSVLRRLVGLDGTGSSGEGKGRAKAGKRAGRKGVVRKRKGSRAPAGSLLPEEEYFEPILRVVKEKGGRAPTQEVIGEVGRLLGDHLTELDQETLSSGGVRWENRAQFARLKLVNKGLLKKNSPRGVWEISDQGVEYLEGSE